MKTKNSIAKHINNHLSVDEDKNTIELSGKADKTTTEYILDIMHGPLQKSPFLICLSDDTRLILTGFPEITDKNFGHMNYKLHYSMLGFPQDMIFQLFTKSASGDKDNEYNFTIIPKYPTTPDFNEVTARVHYTFDQTSYTRNSDDDEDVHTHHIADEHATMSGKMFSRINSTFLNPSISEVKEVVDKFHAENFPKDDSMPVEMFF